jgi:hypothetical protein
MIGHSFPIPETVLTGHRLAEVDCLSNSMTELREYVLSFIFLKKC